MDETRVALLNRGSNLEFGMSLCDLIEAVRHTPDISAECVYGLMELAPLLFPKSPPDGVRNELRAVLCYKTRDAVNELLNSRSVEPRSNDFYLGRWAFLGDTVALGELVRRANHRDGSTAAMVEGSDAEILLEGADEATRATLDTMGYQRGKYSNSPAQLTPEGIAGVPMQVDGAPENWPEAASTSVVPTPQTDKGESDAQPVARAVDAEFDPDATVQADLDSLTVRVEVENGQTGVECKSLVVALRVAPAVEFFEQLGAAIRKLIIPGEAFQWDDNGGAFEWERSLLLLVDLGSPAATLFNKTLQGESAAGKPVVIARVDQDPDSGFFHPLFHPEGQNQPLPEVSTLAEGKALVAAAVRAAMKAGGV